MLMTLLRDHLKPYWRTISAIVLLQLIQTLASLYLPSLNADIIDNGVAVGDTGHIMRVGGFMLVITVLQITATITAVYLAAKTAMGLGRDVRASVFTRVQKFSARELAHFGAPSLITRNTNDVQQVQMVVLLSFTIMIMAPIMLVGGVVMALRQDVTLSWLLVVIIPVLVTAVLLIARKLGPLFKQMQNRIDRVNTVLREQITGIRVVRAFVRDEHEHGRFEVANAQLTSTSISIGRLMALLFPTVMLVMNLSSAAVLWFGGQRIDSQEMQIGALTAFLTYIVQILMAVMMAVMMFVLVPRAAVSAERIQEVLNTESSVIAPPDPVREMPRRGSVEMSAVEFHYPGAEEPVLRNISFSAHRGKTTAIIGSTGAGKTTLIQLIPRLFDATAGTVYVGGVPVAELEPKVLGEAIGYVPQRPYLFTGTVASNLRYGNPHAPDAELWQALEIAQAADFVADMPDQLQAPISQGGTNVSGGQRQRLSIARAIVRKPDIYLFDDSFSALDVSTDAALRAALSTITAQATTIVVGQRVSTIRNADEILVLDAGEIVGSGTHEYLLETCRTYQEIVASQMDAQEAAQ
ncbi:MAG TPA: ABC transporter ATP-binding protein [Actinomycetales bacterium]|nr:ABC transporter ATP-binding protein [Actinomycetales bacterium]